MAASIVAGRSSRENAMRVFTGTSTAVTKQRSARFIASAMAAVFATSALWVMTSGLAPHRHMPVAGQAGSSGHTLIPSGVPDWRASGMDDALARQRHKRATKKSGEQTAPGKAVDAIYRIAPRSVSHKGHRFMA
jgi:hypothetical protein